MVPPIVDPPPAKQREPLRVMAAGLVAVVLWASAFVGVRAAGTDLSPGALSLARLAVGSLALGVFVLARRETMPSRSDLPLLVFYGFLWFGVYNVTLNWSEQLIDAGTAAMIVSLGPVLIALLAGLLLKEGFPRSLLVGCAIAFSGVVVIGTATASQNVSAGLGSLLALVAAITYAAGVVSQKPLLDRSSVLVITWLGCIIGAAFCLPFTPQLLDELPRASSSAITWTVYLGVFPTAIAFTAWGYALSRSTAGRMGAMTYLAAPLSTLMAWLLLGEVPPWAALAGGALCLTGVIISRRGPRP
ncbi:DMT family transporter [Streptosporangium longisporum]|uniref:DMT family transporter n=1 Tax=Streptosporangium longisporum TaxID=46187 RepID=A0ABP6KW69_9ACTN